MATEKDLQFDGWTVNRVSGEISRGGRTARLPPQPLRILTELFDRAGEVVTREDLVKALWPAGIVDFDNGLNVAMRKLRVALDDVGDAPRYIETLPRVGYRFIGIRDERAAQPPTPRTLPRARIALSLALLTGALALGWWLGLDRTGVAKGTRRHVPSVRAQELYLDGLNLRSRRDIDTTKLAREKFDAALREDPDYAQAWAALGANISVGVLRQDITPAEGIPKARAAALRSIELDPGLIEGRYLLGQIYLDHDKDFDSAREEFERALALNDNSARLWNHYAMWHGHMGHVEESLQALRRAREFEPMTLMYAGHYGFLLYEARRYDEAIAHLRPLVEANPGFDEARSFLGRALMASGDFAGALEQLQARGNPGLQQSDLGILYAKMGRREDAMREIERLEQRGRAGFAVAYDLALIHTALGDFNRGCELLARAVTDHSIMVNWMRLDPPLDPLRGRRCYADAERRLYGNKGTED